MNCRFTKSVEPSSSKSGAVRKSSDVEVNDRTDVKMLSGVKPSSVDKTGVYISDVFYILLFTNTNKIRRSKTLLNNESSVIDYV